MNASISSLASSAFETTTVTATTIHAPNCTIVDDTPNATLSRAVARIIAKGLHVAGVYGGEEQGSSVAGRVGVRTFEIDVAVSPGADAIGYVIVKVITDRVALRTGGYETVRSTRIGFDKIEVARALGWRDLEA
jgi:hypothetical protein